MSQLQQHSNKSSDSDSSPSVDAGYRYPFDLPAGSATESEKRILIQALTSWMRKATWFAGSVGQRLKVTKVDVSPSPEGKEGRKTVDVECEVKVEEDMVNAFGTLHGGCSGFLIDVCTTLPLIVISDEKWGAGGITHGLNVVFHSPALVGSVLQIKASSVAAGGRSATARCEIWDRDRQALVATGTNIKMTQRGLQLSKL